MGDRTADVCVIAVGYSRPDAMQRLLDSLTCAIYSDEKVDLLVSVDKGPRQAEVAEVAEKTEWKYGDKHIRVFPERQGLRSHILQCGDKAFEYKAVVILEDDITVSKGYYSYVRQCLDFYGDNDTIGGISLYNYYMNETSRHFFEPEFNGYDCFAMQTAQSWGQCWTTKMWTGFRKWYDEHTDFFDEADNPAFKNIPDNILRWDNKSWKKYYMAYISEKNMYYIYPYHSLSTNHSGVGEHNNIVRSDYQVAMNAVPMEYRLPSLEDAVKYDMFFEREGVKVKGYEDKKVVLDFYGNKKDFCNGDVLISTVARPYKVLEKWALKYRPQELNCIFAEHGNDIFVYDLHTPADAPKNCNPNLRTRYDVRDLFWKKTLNLGLYEFKQAICRKLRITK